MLMKPTCPLRAFVRNLNFIAGWHDPWQTICSCLLTVSSEWLARQTAHTRVCAFLPSRLDYFTPSSQSVLHTSFTTFSKYRTLLHALYTKEQKMGKSGLDGVDGCPSFPSFSELTNLRARIQYKFPVLCFISFKGTCPAWGSSNFCFPKSQPLMVGKQAQYKFNIIIIKRRTAE